MSAVYENTSVGTPESRAPQCAFVLDSAVRLDGKQFASIPLELLRIDFAYQREIHGSRWAKVINIANGWNPDKAGAILVSFRPALNFFFIIDGQGRYEAAKRAGEQSITACILEDQGIESEAKLFLSQDDNTTRVGQHDKVKAGIIAKHENCLRLQSVMQKYGIERPQEISSIGTALGIAAANPTELDWIFRTIHQAGWDEMTNGYSRSVFKALHQLYEREFNHLDRVETTLVPVMAANSPNVFRSVADLTGNSNKAKFMNVYKIMSDIIAKNNGKALQRLRGFNMQIPVSAVLG